MANAIIALTLVIHFANYADAPDTVVRDAQAEVADILSDIGVNVEWAPIAGSTPARADAVRVTLVPYEGGSLRQNGHQVLGAATRTEFGTGVAVVFFQRVVEEAAAYAVPTARILACAIAHEIGHLLRREPTHDSTGLMRAVWSRADFREASAGRLRFEPRTFTY